MQISWINKFSLLDFPWKVSCIVFTPWCNFRCAFCHNPEFVLPELLKESIKNLISEKAFFTFLEKRKWLLDWVSVCWGEPTLQKDLFEFCQKIKNMWFLVKLDTNWRNPNIIKKLLKEKVIDYIAMDIKNPAWKMSEIAGVQLKEEAYLKSINILLNSSIDYEFRTTVIAWVHKRDDIEKISKLISWAKNYFIQNFKKKNILKPDFDWKSFDSNSLEIFKEIALKYIEKVEIRD